MSDTVIASIISAVVSATISAAVSWGITAWSLRKKDKSELDAELSDILKIGIDHPFFEVESFTQSWKPALVKTDERYAAYDLYATLVFNYLEKYCRYRDFDEKEFLSELDTRNWILVHKNYWRNPINPFENKDAYDSRFVAIVQKVIA